MPLYLTDVYIIHFIVSTLRMKIEFKVGVVDQAHTQFI